MKILCETPEQAYEIWQLIKPVPMSEIRRLPRLYEGRNWSNEKLKVMLEVAIYSGYQITVFEDKKGRRLMYEHLK